MYSRVSNNHTVYIKQKDNYRVFSIKLNVQRMIGMTLLDLTNKHGEKLERKCTFIRHRKELRK